MNQQGQKDQASKELEMRDIQTATLGGLGRPLFLKHEPGMVVVG